MSKKTNRTVTVISIGIIILALTVVLSAVFAPALAGKKELRQVRRVLAEGETYSYVSVLEPLDRSGNFLPADEEVRLTDSAQIADLRDRLLTYMDRAKYSGAEEALGGNWDIRVRFAGGELTDIYLHEDYFYLSQNGRKFIFKPADASAYTAWRAEWLTSLFGAVSAE